MAASYEKFNYLTRPAKQIERKLLIEGFHTLIGAGFPISTYRYLGLGSPFFADFMLFHKYLYIDDLWCIEGSAIPRRMKFNKPFPEIRLSMGKVSEFIPQVDRDRLHLVWLDYDYPLNEEMLDDLKGFARVLRPESVLIATIECDPRLPGDLPDDLLDKIREHRRDALQASIGRYVEGGVKLSDLEGTSLPKLYATVIRNILHDAFRSRELAFHQLFNFVYADGRQMITVGGMVGDKQTTKKLKIGDVYDRPFVTTSALPIGINVPPLTVRERLWLDQNKSASKKFELREGVSKHYRKYYRYYPAYFEALL